MARIADVPKMALDKAAGGGRVFTLVGPARKFAERTGGKVYSLRDSTGKHVGYLVA